MRKNHFLMQPSIGTGGSRPSSLASSQSKSFPIRQILFMRHRVLNAAPLIHRFTGGTSKSTSQAAHGVVLMQPIMPPSLGPISGNCPTPSWSFLICSVVTRPLLHIGSVVAAPMYRAVSHSLAPVPKFCQRPSDKSSRLA